MGLIEGYAWQDSNLRPLGPQPNALSPELQAHARRATDILPPNRQIVTKKTACMTGPATPIEIDMTDLKRRGPSLPSGEPRTGRYRIEFTDGEHYCGHTDNIVLRIGSHRRTWDDMRTITYWPGLDYEAGAMTTPNTPLRISRPGPPLRKVDADLPDIDPVLDRMQWADERLLGRPDARPIERPDQRERTRPLFDRLSAHPDFERLVSLVARYLDLLVPAPASTEVGNWVITSLPSTVRTRLWHRLICLSINNVEALTIGEQFDGECWTTLGFMTANPSERRPGTLLPETLRARGVFMAPAWYKTVGPVYQVGFDSLDGLDVVLEDDEILDLTGAMAMRLMRRGRGLYGRFHDYNLADRVLDMPPADGVRDAKD
jgi:hypothetical protein